MNGPQEHIQEQATRQPCLNAGCSCKDARIVSRRKAAYFAARAQATGQTADRVIAPQRGWRIAALSTPDQLA